jgi:hypothetical protein
MAYKDGGILLLDEKEKILLRTFIFRSWQDSKNVNMLNYFYSQVRKFDIKKPGCCQVSDYIISNMFFTLPIYYPFLLTKVLPGRL